MPNLTAKGVDALIRQARAGERVKEFTPDGAGVYLRVRTSGAASFWLRQSGFAPLKLCDADLGLARARELALKARAARSTGDDPAAERKAARERQKAEKATIRAAEKVAASIPPDALGAVFSDYERRRLRGLRSGHAVGLVFRQRVLPIWGDLPIGSINRAMAAKLVHDVADEYPRAGDLLLQYLRGFFEWSIGMGFLEANPCERVPRPVTNESRERVLSDAELRLIWLAAEKMPWPDAPFIKLLMISAQRKSEVGAGLWSEIDLAARTWSLPASRVKNGNAHKFPLPPLAIEILSSIERKPGEDRIFAGPRGGASWGDTKSKARLDAIVAELNGGEPIPHWILHDLRRTAATKMGDLEIAPHVIETVLNHTGWKSGVAGIYNRSSYWPQMVDALNRWSTRLQVIVSAENVISLQRRKGA